MATPHVAGAAALLAAHAPSLSVASLKATLMNTVDVLPAFTGFNKSSGRMNVFNALSDPTVCNITPSQTSIAAPTKGGVFSVPVSALSNCDYSIRSNANWIKVMSPENASGNSELSLWITVNPTITRSATVSVGGQVITVTQSRAGKF